MLLSQPCHNASELRQGPDIKGKGGSPLIRKPRVHLATVRLLLTCQPSIFILVTYQDCCILCYS